MEGQVGQHVVRHLLVERVVLDEARGHAGRLGLATGTSGAILGAGRRQHEPGRRYSRAVNQKVLPRPGVLSTPTSPPISVARWRVQGQARARLRRNDLRGGQSGLLEGAREQRAAAVRAKRPMPVSPTSKPDPARDSSPSSTMLDAGSRRHVR